MLRLIKRNVVSQSQRVVRTLTCDTHGLSAKFSVTKTFAAEPCVDGIDRRSLERARWKKMASQRQVVEAELVKYKYRQQVTFQKKITEESAVERKHFMDEPSPDRSNGMSVEQKARQAHKILSQRLDVAPERLKFVKERHQQSIAEAEVRCQNSIFCPTRQELHSGRLSKII